MASASISSPPASAPAPAPSPTISDFLSTVNYAPLSAVLQDRLSRHSIYSEQLRLHQEHCIEVSQSIAQSIVDNNKDNNTPIELSTSNKALFSELTDFLSDTVEWIHTVTAADTVLQTINTKLTNNQISYNYQWKTELKQLLTVELESTESTALLLTEQSKQLINIKRKVQEILYPNQPFNSNTAAVSADNNLNQSTAVAVSAAADAVIDDDIQEGPSNSANIIPICPLTQLELVDPVESKLCHHLYERTAVVSYIKLQLQLRPLIAPQCPRSMCSKKLEMNDLVRSLEIKRRIEKLNKQKDRLKQQRLEQGLSINHNYNNNPGELDLTQSDSITANNNTASNSNNTESIRKVKRERRI